MCQIMKYNECGGIKSLHHFLSSLIWRLTFVAAAVAQSRCGSPPPPKAEFAQSHGAQPSMINCEQLLCEQRGPLLVFIPLARLNTGELLSAGSRQRLCVTRHFKWISTSCQTATATWTDRVGAEEVRSGTQQTWHLSSFVLHLAALLFHWKGSGEMSKSYNYRRDNYDSYRSGHFTIWAIWSRKRSANERVCFSWKR